jgi:serine/threonine protein kinase
MPENLIGLKLGQYEIVSKIGQGGMAQVYKAYQPSIDRYVAVKILAESMAKDAHFLERFILEARAVAALEHPHILPVYDFGTQDGLNYMVMRYVDGGTVADLMSTQKTMTYTDITRIIGDLANALDYAHSKGIVHRDIKPGNMLIDQHGEVLLADFGLARIIENSPKSRLTQAGTVVGTASYMAPEQAADEPLDGRSDIYSLGVVLFEMLTGRPPFDGETLVAIALKHVNEPTPSLRAINPDIPLEFEQVVFTSMEKWPDDRFQTGMEMAQALTAALRMVSSQQIVTRSISLPGQPAVASSGAESGTGRNRPRSPSRVAVVAPPVETAPSPATPAGSGPIETIKQPWLWGSIIIATLTTMLVIGGLAFWFQPNSSPPDGMGQGQPPPPLAAPVPENSLVYLLPDSQAILDSMGGFNNRFARSNHAYQLFEGGMAYWWENPAAELDPIYIIDGATTQDTGTNWSQYKNTWTPEQPDVPDYCLEAAGPNGPVMRFGRLWCYNVAVKNTLGSALEPENSGNDATVESYENGIVFSVPATGTVWVLYNDGTWQEYPVDAVKTQ